MENYEKLSNIKKNDRKRVREGVFQQKTLVNVRKRVRGAAFQKNACKRVREAVCFSKIRL